MALGLVCKRLGSYRRAGVSYLEIWNILKGGGTRAVRRPHGCCNPRPVLLHTNRQLKTYRNGNDSSSTLSELLEKYKTSLKITPPTHEIRDLALDQPSGIKVVLHGYLGSRSDLSKKLSFVPLLSRDLRHSVQIISNSKPEGGDVDASTAHAELKIHGAGTPVLVRGTLKARPQASDPSIDIPSSDKKPNKRTERQNGIVSVRKHEVQLNSLEVLNTMPRDILMTSDTVYPPEQRHLYMRQNASVREALAFRSDVARACRTCLEDQFGFSEIETPLLFKSTPEGAREFLVPTRRRDSSQADEAKGALAYALPQSPQQFKQVLMGSGISRYYQLARCFRDEDLRADRQPEFTQLDLEMAFAGSEEVMQVITTLLRALWKDLLGSELPKAFPRLKYANAMAKYGVDKPDVRLGMELSRVDYLLPVDLVSKISPLTLPAVDAMVLRFTTPTPPSGTRTFISEFLDSPDAAHYHSNPHGAPGIFIVDSSKPLSGLQPLGFEAAEALEDKFGLEDGDLLVLQARPDKPYYSGGSIALGNLRLDLHREAVRQELIEPPTGFAPLWVTDFPLFTPSSSSTSEPGQGGHAGLSSTHHPFTSPKTGADVDLLLKSHKGQSSSCGDESGIDTLYGVIGEHYDIVMNGIELGGGSRRIHDADVQRYIMAGVLKMDPTRVEAEFGHLLAVLRAGCPPHAGIALGFDRLVAMMLGRDSVRDVIAFPKTGGGEDPLMRSPGLVSAERLREYRLKVIG